MKVGLTVDHRFADTSSCIPLIQVIEELWKEPAYFLESIKKIPNRVPCDEIDDTSMN